MQSRGRSPISRDISVTAVLMALGACLGYAESVLLPALPIPGVRLGLANLAVVVALTTVGRSNALVVSLGRVLLVALATGSLAGPAQAMSLAGAVAAWGVMAALSARGDTFSPVGWSLAGSAAHVLAQLAVASWLVGSSAPLLMMPLSLGASVPAGLAVGYSARLLVSRIPSVRLVFGH